MLRQIPAADVETLDGVVERETVEDGDRVRNTMTGVENDTRRVTCRVHRENRLHSDENRRHFECFEHDLSHFFFILFGIQRNFGEKNGVFFGVNTQSVVERVVPDLQNRQRIYIEHAMQSYPDLRLTFSIVSQFVINPRSTG